MHFLNTEYISSGNEKKTTLWHANQRVQDW